LTTTCQVVNEQIRMEQAPVRASILRKTLCPGLGLEARFLTHCPCPLKGWVALDGCGGEGYDVVSKPCVGCELNTCDECRFHIFYHVAVDDVGLDGHRWWAGYFFSHPTPIAVYPPKGPEGASWYLPRHEIQSHHDQGRLHAPLDIGAVADPEPIERILDINMGAKCIQPWGRTTAPFSGRNIIKTFDAMFWERIEMVCMSCSKEQLQLNYKPCSCTLRKHYLDRWTCITCHAYEVDQIEALREGSMVVVGGQLRGLFCRCGGELMGAKIDMICRWCRGHISDSILLPDDEGDVGAKGLKNNDDNDENAGPAPAFVYPNTMQPVENKDGTLSIYCNGTRISGERISRKMVTAWESTKSSKVPCVCCKCFGKTCDHSRVNGPNRSHGNSIG
jgi:hypothetical protein